MSTSYTNIYFQPLLKIDKRNNFNNFINDNTIFIPDFLYQSGNSSYGVQTNPRIYLFYGIEQKNLRDYASAMTPNFYRKRFLLGELKTAIAKDSSHNHIYDVVYLDAIDDQSGVSGSFTGLDGNTYYTSSMELMRQDFINAGFSTNYFSRPLFMRTIQPESFDLPNFIKCMILCYALPGQGQILINRIKHSKFDFTQLDFDIDRIYIESTLDYPFSQYLLFPRQTIKG
jgi:hypothetical protein